MKTITLYERDEHCTNPHRNALVDDIDELMLQKVHVYRTFAFATDRQYPRPRAELDFTFTTTHKYTCLAFGSLKHETLRHLGFLLEEAFEDGKMSEVLAMRGGGKDGGWFVTRTQSGWDVNYTFSPAR